MLGAIIGDIVGSRFEWHNRKSKDFELFTEQCRCTDDTAMTVAIAKALLECDGKFDYLSDRVVGCMQDIGRRYLNCGFGQSFWLWLHKENPKPYGSYGNGAAMRIRALAAHVKAILWSDLVDGEIQNIILVFHHFSDHLLGGSVPSIPNGQSRSPCPFHAFRMIVRNLRHRICNRDAFSF